MATAAARTIVSLLTLVGLVALLTGFQSFRDPSAGGPPPTTTTNSTAPAPAPAYPINTTALCIRACGLPPAACNQSASSGVVYACTRCADSAHTPVGSACMSDLCAGRPWCRSSLLPVLQLVHKAFTRAPPAPDITLSTNWTLIQPYFPTAAAATRVLTLYETGYLATPTLSAGVFLDDQSGWWANSLVAYDAAVPLDYMPYLDALKRAVCLPAISWRLNTTTGTCVAPAV
jgi:hypothetical protein